MNELSEIIRDEIRTNGPMRFKRFMELALYHPELGYYNRRVKIGSKTKHSGSVYDFSTHPETYSPHYGNAFARLITTMALQLPEEVTIHEQGAGNGTLAKDILDPIKIEYPSFYERIHYIITDISPLLREKQEEKLADHSCVRIQEGSAITTPIPSFNGFMITNELPDAFPVDLVLKVDNSFYVVTVDEKNGEFFPLWDIGAGEREMRYVEQGGYLPRVLPFKPADVSQSQHEIANELIRVAVPINEDMLLWYDRLTKSLERGAIITTDYGKIGGGAILDSLLEVKERALRTFKDGETSRAQMNPFIEVGERDMTSDVNFIFLTMVGQKNGLDSYMFLKERDIVDKFAGFYMNNSFETLIHPKGITIPL